MHPSPLSVSLDGSTSTLFTILAASSGASPEDYAKTIIEAHCAGAAEDEAIMARIGRALLAKGEPKVITKKPTLAKRPVKATPVEAASPAGSFSLPPDHCRTKNGVVMHRRECRAMTFSTEEAGDYLGVSGNLVLRAVKEKAVTPFAYLGAIGKYPRFTESELEQINSWLKTPDPDGKPSRTHKCEKCNRYLGKPGLRLHELHCTGDNTRLSLGQRR